MKAIEEKRKENGWTRKFLAAKIGITPACLFNYERGKRAIKIETLKKLANVFHCSIDELVN